jgi:ATP-dependent DNA ligase I
MSNSWRRLQRWIPLFTSAKRVKTIKQQLSPLYTTICVPNLPISNFHFIRSSVAFYSYAADSVETDVEEIIKSDPMKAKDQKAMLLMASFVRFVVSQSDQLSSRENSLKLAFYLNQLLRSSKPDIIIRVIQMLSGKFQLNTNLLFYALNMLTCAPDEDIGSISKLEKKAKRTEKLSDMFCNLLRSYLLGKRVHVAKYKYEYPNPVLSIQEFCKSVEKIQETRGEHSLELQIQLLADLLRKIVDPAECKGVMSILSKEDALQKTIFRPVTLITALAVAFAENPIYNSSKLSENVLAEGINNEIALGRKIEDVIAKILKTKSVDWLSSSSVEPVLAKDEVVISVTPKDHVIPSMLAKTAVDLNKVFKTTSDIRLECKYDGNRVQIYYNKGAFKYYSRSQIDISDTLNALDVHLMKIIKSKDTESFIIDAEVYAYNEKSNEPYPFQYLQPQIAKLKSSEGSMPVRLAVFDLLKVNDNLIIEQPLKERLNLLDVLFEVPSENESEDGGTRPKQMIHKPYYKLVKGTMDINERIAICNETFQRCLDRKYEGLIIKDMDKPYVPAARNWYKYKKNINSGGVFDTLDLVCIGANFGNGKRADVYGSFLLAVYNEKTSCYETLTKVASGFTTAQLRFISDELNKFVIKEPQDNYVISASIRRSIDVWFKPHVIMEISGMEFTWSPQHTCAADPASKVRGIGLRFPKFIRRRDADKPLKEITTVSQVQEMFQKSNAKEEEQEQEGEQ